MADVQDGNHGELHPKTSDYTTSGVPFIMARDIVDGRINFGNCSHISEERANYLRVGFAHPGDVLLTHKATMGRVAIVPEEYPRVVLTPQVTYYRVADPSQLCNRYLRYAFLAPSFQHQLVASSDQSTRNYMGIKAQYDLWLPLPSIGEQRAIASILGALDDKIELNRQINETLETMARAIFKSWFVDFDPVRAKVEGGPPAGMNGQTAALFPDHFEDTDLGAIPLGWRVGALGVVATNPRRTIQPVDVPKGTAYIGLEHMPRGSISLTEWADAGALASAKFAFRRGEILFGKLRPYFHKVGVAPVDGVCSTDILVLAPTDPAWFAFVLGHVSSDEFVAYTDASSAGTRMPRTNWLDMSRYVAAIPPQAISEALTKQVAPLVDRLIVSTWESRALASLRDTLLPRLLSGELRVRDAERAVEMGL